MSRPRRGHLQRARACRGAVVIAAAVLSLFAASGCAIQYVDAQGARHVVGLAHVVMHEQPSAQGSAYLQQVTTVGIALLRVPEHKGVSVGYTRNFSLSIFDPDAAGLVTIDLFHPQDFSYRSLLVPHEEKSP